MSSCNIISHMFFKGAANAILDTLQTIVLAVSIFMISYLFLVQPHQVKGPSMLPNFKDGEYLLTEKVSYKISNPKRGDVVIFEAPPNRRDDYIKRIIGLPGDTVSVKEGKVYLNGQLLNEAYLPSDFQTQPGTFLTENTQYKVPDDQYFVFGDNRGHSSDSRAWGPVKRKAIVGRTWLVYWPPQLMGFVKRVVYAGF